MGCGASTNIVIDQSKPPYQKQTIASQNSRNKDDKSNPVKAEQFIIDSKNCTTGSEDTSLKYINMASIEKVFFGDLNVEFSEDINIVRIFTSSTFTDTSVERNTLMSRVYPRIKTFCQEKGYDFQVVDLRWGIREESMDDHSMSDLCMKELQACQKLSTGPNFITFLGQKYGYRPLPPKIEAVELEQLIHAIEVPEDVELVKDWYQEDDNSVPSDYVLQPISSRLVHFRDHEHAQLRDEAAAKWMEIYGRLHSILSKAADKVLAPDVARKYHMSVTEHEIRRGVMESSCPEKQCFWFKRVIKDLRENVDKPKAPSFIDVARPEAAVDETAQDLLDSLKAQEMSSLLPKDNVIQYEIHWSEEGIDPKSSKEHEQYIDKLCDNFYEVLTKTINDGIEKKKSIQPKDLLTKELYHQGLFCKRKCQSFHGRKGFLSTVKNKLLNNGAKRIVVIHGESGCGKTSIMAKIASEMRKWITDKFQHPEDSFSSIEPCVVVYRFLGTSPDSSSPRLLLRSICEQLCRVSSQPTRKIPEDMKSLTEYFPHCLATAASYHPIILLLDSLDQITGQGWSQELNWWPKVLPKNVYAVLSTLPGREFHCLSYLKSYLPPHCFLEVPKMTYEEAEVILDSWLNSVKRVLQPKQKKIVLDGFRGCQLPLYLKLTFDEASRWKSYTPENETQIGADVEAIINALFDCLENKYGKILVSQAFGYITASKSGLTELELDDLLSLDDTVLNDIYQFWTPPIRRMLPLLWFRLHSDVEDYLVKRGADGVPVVYWYHRQFIETAKKRYLDPEKVEELHKSMVEYYVGKWSDGKKKPYINDSGVEVPMDRLVASQPVLYDANPEQTVFNKRKISELPFHMIHARELIDLKKEAFCNFDFLSAKLRATSLEELLEDFAYATSVFDNDDDLHAVNRFFHLSSMALRNDRNQLASQIIGRLGPFTNDDKHPFVGKLVKQAQFSGVTGLPNFVTSEKCLTSPGGALISSLTVNDQNACCSFSCDGVHVFVGSSNKEGLCLQVLVNSNGKLVRQFSLNLPEKERAFRWTLKASALHKDLVLVGGAQNMILLDTNTKHIVKTFHVLRESMKNFVYPFAFLNEEKQIAAISDEGVKVWNTDDRKVMHFINLPGVTVDTVKALDAHSKWVVYSVQDDGFNILNAEDGNQETIFKLQDTIKEIKITEREEIIVLTSKRKKLHIFDLKSKGLIREVSEFECYFGINRLQLTIDGTKAVSFSDKDILISTLETGQVQRIPKPELFEENIDCTQLFSGDGVNVFAVGYDKVLRVYHLDKLANSDMIEQVSERKLLSGTISSVYPSYGNRYLPTKTITNGQKELTIWDVKDNKPRRVRCLRHEEGINELRMCSPTRAVAKFFSEGSQNCGFGVLDLKEGQIERYLPGDANLLWSVGFTDDIHFMAFSREKRRLQVWDINKGVITFKHRFDKKQPISEALMNRDQSYVICGLVKNAKLPHKSLPLIAFDCRNNRHHVLKFKKQQLTLHSASISHDGRVLIALTLETVPTLWDVPSGKLLFVLPIDSVHATGVSSRRNIVITCRGETDGVLHLWSIETGSILSQFDTEPTHKILMNPDENVAYTFQANNFYSWDLVSRRRLASFTMDWAPIPRHVFEVGNAVMVPIPEAPLMTSLRLHGQGYDGAEVESCDEAYSNVTVDGKLLLSSDT